MAFLTLNHAVSASQRKARERVIEFRIFPKLLTVAFTAIWKRAGMYIIFFMTEHALLAEARKLSTLLVALGALQDKMYAREAKVFVEVFGRLPGLLAVAAVATLAKVSLVNVFVTGDALAADRLVSDHWYVFLKFLHKFFRCRLMALRTFEFLVLSLEQKLRLSLMVKLRRFPFFLRVA
jgi:hypothetical protein